MLLLRLHFRHPKHHPFAYLLGTHSIDQNGYVDHYLTGRTDEFHHPARRINKLGLYRIRVSIAKTGNQNCILYMGLTVCRACNLLKTLKTKTLF